MSLFDYVYYLVFGFILSSLLVQINFLKIKIIIEWQIRWIIQLEYIEEQRKNDDNRKNEFGGRLRAV